MAEYHRVPYGPVGLAVIGLGRAGMFHLPNLSSNPEVVVRWLVDVAELQEKAQLLRGQYNLQEAVFVTPDLCEQIYSDKLTQAVIITAPTAFHEVFIKGAVAAGKHVFCEKPISFTAESVKSCYEDARKHGCHLFCAFNRRFDAHHIQLRDKLQAGLLGSPRVVRYSARDSSTSSHHINTYIRNSGGIFCDSAIHQLDYVVWLLGESPNYIMAVGGRTSEEAVWFDACKDLDGVLIILLFPSSVRADIEVLREAQPCFSYVRMEVIGTQGSHFCHKSTDSLMTTISMDGRGTERCHGVDFSASHKAEMDCFLRVIKGEEVCPLLENEVIMASHLADLCSISLKEGRLIAVDYCL